jgi:hypothetical protein
MAIIDCCTGEIVAFGFSLLCRAEEAVAVVERGIQPGELTLGSGSGSGSAAAAATAIPSRRPSSGAGSETRRTGGG